MMPRLKHGRGLWKARRLRFVARNAGDKTSASVVAPSCRLGARQNAGSWLPGLEDIRNAPMASTSDSATPLYLVGETFGANAPRTSDFSAWFINSTYCPDVRSVLGSRLRPP